MSCPDLADRVMTRLVSLTVLMTPLVACVAACLVVFAAEDVDWAAAVEEKTGRRISQPIAIAVVARLVIGHTPLMT